MAVAFEYSNGTVLQTSSAVILFYEQAGSSKEQYEPWDETVWCHEIGAYWVRTVRWNADGSKEALVNEKGESFFLKVVDVP